ncbi:MAG: FAD-dependent monooxygenase [Burkholderiales bacterium]|nr:FAD-dependent monooxygenase [Burkholderiales bacterium]
MSSPTSIDVAILGGGPAGCSAASWLGQLGMTTLLVEREPRLCATLAALDFKQDWVLGEPATLLSDLAEHYAAQAPIRPRAGRCNSPVASACRHARCWSPPGCAYCARRAISRRPTRACSTPPR